MREGGLDLKGGRIEQSSHNETYMGFVCKGRLKLGSLDSI